MSTLAENNSPPPPAKGENTPEGPVLDEITLQIAQMLKKGMNMQNPNLNSEKIILSVKLNGENYSLWARLMRVEIGIRGRTQHITGETRAPASNDPEFFRWEQEDLQVFSWILQNLELRLMNTVSQFQSAKALWDALAVTYGSGSDALQIYDLHNQASRQTQGGRPLEDYWNDLQAMWLAIDQWWVNLRKCDVCWRSTTGRPRRTGYLISSVALTGGLTPFVERFYALSRSRQWRQVMRQSGRKLLD